MTVPNSSKTFNPIWPRLLTIWEVWLSIIKCLESPWITLNMHGWSQTALAGFSHLECVWVYATGIIWNKLNVYHCVCGTENLLQDSPGIPDMHTGPFWLTLRHANSLIDAIKAQKGRKLCSQGTVSCCRWPTFCSFFPSFIRPSLFLFSVSKTTLPFSPTRLFIYFSSMPPSTKLMPCQWASEEVHSWLAGTLKLT